MQETDWISLIAVAEFALIVTLALVVIGARVFRRSRRDNAAAEALVSKVKGSEQARRGELETLLAQGFGLSGEELKEKAHELLRVEKHFYEQFIHTYLARDSTGLSTMDDKLKTVIAAYLEVKSDPAAAIGEDMGEVDADTSSADLARLKTNLRNLTADMNVYRETLNKVFSEYTAMFGVHLDPKQQLTAKEIMSRLESGQLGGEEAAAEDAEADTQPS